MAILHTINKSPYEKNSLESCLRYAKKGSALLFIEDGIYAVVKGSSVAADLVNATDEISLYCLESDVKARGFASTKIMEVVQLVDYDGFVDLSVEYDKVQAWL
ncbi:hypothetical protein MNBD_GAMMA26-612 [hydrothermal vent metagenome]|uniref:tRNA 5-methylaminomethyl-2-thiouridine synthase subunit TusB n=1 Tax=hydrothermal vent metagenome TaxID=652676 RepID=A0A3B1AIZ8_9ZZZZ